MQQPQTIRYLVKPTYGDDPASYGAGVEKDLSITPALNKTRRYRPSSNGTVIEYLEVSGDWWADGKVNYFFDFDKNQWIKVAPALGYISGVATDAEIAAVGLSPAEQEKVRLANEAAAKAEGEKAIQAFRVQHDLDLKAMGIVEGQKQIEKIVTYQDTQDEKLKTMLVRKWEGKEGDTDYTYREFADGHIEKEENKGFFDSVADVAKDIGKGIVQGYVGYITLGVGSAYGVLANTGEGQKIVDKIDPISGGIIKGTLLKPGQVAAKFTTTGEANTDEVIDALKAGGRIATGAVAVGGSVNAAVNAGPGISSATSAVSIANQFKNAEPLKIGLSEAKNLNDNYSLLPKGDNVDLFGTNVDKYLNQASTMPVSQIATYLTSIPTSIPTAVQVGAAAGNLTPAQIAQGVKAIVPTPPRNNNAPDPVAGGFLPSLSALAGQSSVPVVAGISLTTIALIAAAIYLMRK